MMKGAIGGATTAATAGAQRAPQTAPQKASQRAAQKVAAPEGWKPAFFDSHQNETVVALTDLIIPATDTPGAKAAQVNRSIDLLLNESPAEARRKFLQGLAWLDGYALRTHGAPFVNCSPSQQTALLQSLDPAGRPSGEARPGVEFFREIKGRTVSGYYSSKIGREELNKGGRVPASFGCQHEGHTPAD